MVAILIIFAIGCMAVAAFDEPSTEALTLYSSRQVWVANAVVRSVAFTTAAFLLALASRL